MIKSNIYEQLIAGIDAATILAITDANGVIIHANDAFCEISKYSREELIGKTHKVVNSGIHPKSFFAEMWDTISSGEVWRGEVCNKAKDGSYYWTAANIIPIKDKTGENTHYLALRYDITAEKEKDFNFDLLKKIQSTLFGKQDDLQFVRDEICKIILKETQSEWVYLMTSVTNNNHETFENLCFWQKDQSSLDTPPIPVPPESELLHSEFKKFINWSFTISQPLLFHNSDKLSASLIPPMLTQKINNFVGFPITLWNKKIGFLGFGNSKLTWFSNRIFGFTPVISSIAQILLNNLSEQEKEKTFLQLQEREQQLRHFIRYLPISALIIDNQFRILEYSNDWVKTFDWPSSNLEQKNLWNLFHKHPIEWETLVQGAMQGRSLKSDEEQYITHLGRTLWIEWSVRPWYKGTQIGGAVLLINNLTEQKDLFKEIEQLRYKQLLTSKMASLGEIAGGVAHEINNPLTVIVGAADRLKRYASTSRMTPEFLEQTADKIQATTDRIAQIIKGLKAFSRDSDLDPIVIYSFNQIVKDSLPYLETKLNKYNVEWRWNPRKDYQIECRPVQISQVLVNLITNACDAIQHLEDRWVSLEIEEEKNGITIIIKDSGNGIPKLIADRIMEPFFTTKDIGKGTGLGLSISKSIIEGQNGLFFLDQKSSNTCFVIRMPLKQSLRLSIQNGREAVSLHLAWKQKLIDGLRTNFVSLSPEDDPLKEWIQELPITHGRDYLQEGIIESFDFLFEQTKMMFEMIKNGNKDYVLGELLHSNSTYNSLSKIFVTQIIALEQKTAGMSTKKVA